MEQLFKWIAVGKCDEKEFRHVESLVEEFPYFFAPRLLCLKRTFDTDRASYPEKLRQHAIHIPDFKLLYRYLHRLPPFEQGMAGSPAGGQGEAFEFHGIPARVPVYRIEDEFPEGAGETLSAQREEDPIDVFIREKPGMSRVPVATGEEEGANGPPLEDEEEFFTETLAKIYLKQKLYDKAVATYMKLSLKYPEKSISFARSIEEINEIKNNTK
ncbi:MAG: hypothetical protein LBF09_00915 [Odoribacteraceae bacterium]|jgi:hypothetical protein|nr:hypothetical protein [Odoribacteraceae bacterium]